MVKIFLSLGSNLGDREGFLRKAADLLKENGVRILKKSSIYESEPIGESEEGKICGWFLNQVLVAETSLRPEGLLNLCEEIEKALGRTKKSIIKNDREVFYSRVIDIDILLYGEEKISLDNLVIPHPRMNERRFVLIPLVEIEPSFGPLFTACADSANVRLYESNHSSS